MQDLDESALRNILDKHDEETNTSGANMLTIEIDEEHSTSGESLPDYFRDIEGRYRWKGSSLLQRKLPWLTEWTRVTGVNTAVTKTQSSL